MTKNIIFMGTSEFAVPILKSLHESKYNISTVYTQPPKKSDRGQKITKSPIQVVSEKFDLNLRCPKILKGNEKEYDFLKKLNVDLAIVVAYGKIIPKKFLELTKKGFINIHGSILPKWRGAAPIQRAIMNQDSEIGISIMKINENLDSGPVSNIYSMKLDFSLNFQEVSRKLSILAAKEIIKNINDILSDNSHFVNQDHSKATYAKKIDKKEGKINWSDNVSTILGKINGLYPSPGAYFNFNGERYKILKAEQGDGNGKAGEILSNNLEVACANNKSIKIVEIQRQGKKSQKTKDFILGSQIKKGLILKND